MPERIRVGKLVVTVHAIESPCNEDGRTLGETSTPQIQIGIHYPFQDPELNLRQLVQNIEKERNAHLDAPEEARR